MGICENQLVVMGQKTLHKNSCEEIISEYEDLLLCKIQSQKVLQNINRKTNA